MTSMTEAIEFDPYLWPLQEDPYGAYARLRREAPAYWVQPKGFWVLARYADCKWALQDHRAFSSAEGNLIDDTPNGRGVRSGRPTRRATPSCGGSRTTRSTRVA